MGSFRAASAGEAFGVADADVLPTEDLAGYYHGRLQGFAAERAGHLGRIEECRRAFRAHHDDVVGLGELRGEVGRLQGRLSAIGVQIVQERLKTLRLAASSHDLDMKRAKHREECQRLIAAARQPGAEGLDTVAAGLVAALASNVGPSRCVVRTVELPQDAQRDVAHEDRVAELHQRIADEVCEHERCLEDFQAGRSEVVERDQAAAEAAQRELEAETVGLLSDREVLADAATAFLDLRERHVELQRRYARDVEALRVCNGELARRAEDVALAARRETASVERGARRGADKQARHLRDLELRSRLELDETQAVAIEEMDSMEVCSEALLGKIRELREKCIAHRRHRRLALEGFRADLGVVRRKLEILEGAAESLEGMMPGARQPWANRLAVDECGPRGGIRHRSRGTPYRVPPVSF